jgi:hypothetical protein
VILYGPKPSPHFPRRAAEYELIISVYDAVYRATGCMPAWTVNHDFPGPIGRIAQAVLTLVGATNANAVSLIRELHECRKKKGWEPSAYEELYQKCASHAGGSMD